MLRPRNALCWINHSTNLTCVDVWYITASPLNSAYVSGNSGHFRYSVTSFQHCKALHSACLSWLSLRVHIYYIYTMWVAVQTSTIYRCIEWSLPNMQSWADLDSFLYIYVPIILEWMCARLVSTCWALLSCSSWSKQDSNQAYFNTHCHHNLDLSYVFRDANFLSMFLIV